jgi:fructose-1,6-bisphosphatase
MKITERMKERVRVADTDVGTTLKEQIHDLQLLVKAYEDGRV